MTVTDEINTKLTEAFGPSRLRVVDESDLHAGHAGNTGGGESHFRVEISAPAFAGMSRIARHRAVHAALGADLVGRIHALALHIEG
ncbi:MULTISPECIES: BolA family protein [Actibacterium]|uniref:BolA protein n=1 Tax=Actibacterium naphthalenivorans TaxID=1614693 RepID=A0A840C3H9_9RHOB|nr:MULTISPECIES: BolA family protein [Actibacterium]ALG89853.1 BolA family transcriptional regulator [Actibacterium sp. EMB200-NS6]MBB4020431.1 BolA protein [Actibacterium naphthalenivorans]